MSIIREIDKLEESEILEFDHLIEKIKTGDPSAFDELVARTLNRITNIATILVGGKNGTANVRPSDLTQNAFVKLLKAESHSKIQNVRHYFSFFSRTMSQVLLDYHKAKKTQKRGGGNKQVELDVILNWMDNQDQSIEDVAQAMDALAIDEPEIFELLHLKYFCWLSEQELCAITEYKPWQVQQIVKFGKAYVRDYIESEC